MSRATRQSLTCCQSDSAEIPSLLHRLLSFDIELACVGLAQCRCPTKPCWDWLLAHDWVTQLTSRRPSRNENERQ
jgi:hypothetical protein